MAKPKRVTVTNALKIQALEACKNYLWDGVTGIPVHGYKCMGINQALDAVVANKISDAITVRTLVLHILWCMDGEINVVAWLRKRANVSRCDLSDKAIQAYRLAWINKLIKDLTPAK